MTHELIPELTSDRPINPFVIDLGPNNSRYPLLRELIIDELGSRMSELAEAGYGAGWLVGLEERLAGLCDQTARTGNAQPFGAAIVWPETARRLLTLRSMLGHWVMPAAQGGFQPCPAADPVPFTSPSVLR
jgi:hypothetical protein